MKFLIFYYFFLKYPKFINKTAVKAREDNVEAIQDMAWENNESKQSSRNPEIPKIILKNIREKLINDFILVIMSII